MTMTELVYVRILINQYNIFLSNGLVLLARWAGPSPHSPPLLWAPTSPITALANHSIASSVKCYGPDLAHDRTSQPQYCRFCKI